MERKIRRSKEVKKLGKKNANVSKRMEQSEQLLGNESEQNANMKRKEHAKK